MRKIISFIGIISLILLIGCEKEDLKCSSEAIIELKGLNQPHKFLVNNHNWQDNDGIFRIYVEDNLTIFWEDKNQTYKIHKICDDIGMPYQHILTRNFCENQTNYQGVECIN